MSGKLPRTSSQLQHWLTISENWMNMLFQQNPRVEAAPLNDESILFDPTGSKFFMLNSTSAFIWDRLASPVNAEVLANEICQRFEGVSVDEALVDVRSTLERLRSMDLVMIANATVT